MASILFNRGELALIGSLLSAQGTLGAYSAGGVQLIPAESGQWGVGLGTSSIASLDKASDIDAIGEIGSVTPAGYDRQTLARNTTGWPTASIVNSSYQAAAPQVAFTFTGAPSPNGANMWFLAGSDTPGVDNALFGADLAAERTYSNGSTHTVDCEYRQS